MTNKLTIVYIMTIFLSDTYSVYYG